MKNILRRHQYILYSTKIMWILQEPRWEDAPRTEIAFRDLYFHIPNEIRLETHFSTKEPFYSSKSSSSNSEIVITRQEKVDRWTPFKELQLDAFKQDTVKRRPSIEECGRSWKMYVEGYLRQFLPWIGYQYPPCIGDRRDMMVRASRIIHGTMVCFWLIMHIGRERKP